MALHLRPDDLALLAQDEREVGAVRRRVAWGDPQPREAVGAHPIFVALGQTLDVLHQAFHLSRVCHGLLLSARLRHGMQRRACAGRRRR